jgi:hypothetical protein
VANLDQVPDFIALRGDPSDKVPGASGVGAKGAAALLRRYGTLEALLAQGRFKEQAGELRLYRWIATMNKSAPLPFLRDQTPTWAKACNGARDVDPKSYRVETVSTINGLNMRSAFIAGRNSPIDREPRGSSFHTACGVPGGMIILWPRCKR